MHKPSKIHRRIHKALVRYAVAILSVPVAVAVAMIWTIVERGPDQGNGDQASRQMAEYVRSVTSEPVPSWGGEALNAVYRGIAESSPIQLANACGSGASSCFKCHDGKRASAPKYDEQTSPWHLNHKTVEHSCVGCHKNERIVRKSRTCR
jgi:hypothetical protein